MAKLTTNIETYRVLGETLQHLRGIIRDTLREIFQDQWESRGIPDEIRGNLAKRRARERSIQWHLPDRSDLLEFAGFANLDEIIAANRALGELFSALAPDGVMRHTRFVELDTILNRVSFMRLVTDTELEFAVTFQERIRQVPDDAPRKAAEAFPASAAAPPGGSSPATDEVPPAIEVEDEIGPEPEELVSPTPPDGGTPQAPAQVSTDELILALEEGNDTRVLEAIYHEITTLAESLWTQASAPPSRVWVTVRESPWYTKRFSPLGLKPISDFYALHDAAREALETGASRTDLQEMLQQRKFGEVVLALRELFHARLVS